MHGFRHSQHSMSLITLGINHKTAPLEVRERLAFTPQTLPEALSSLYQLDNVAEAIILSTCNRCELYCIINDDHPDSIIDWLSQYHSLEANSLLPHLYQHPDEAGIKHALEVASGLDSMIVGEPQISGQMKQAYADASVQGTVGQHLSKLFQHAFAVAKQVRTDTAIGSSPVSVAFAAVSLARQIFGDLSESTVLLIGAGDTIELTARHLKKHSVKHMIVANRTVERAQQLADEYDGKAISLQHIAEHLHLADVVISSTASPLPILGKGTVESALKERKYQPIFMVDLAVPRDVEAEVNELDDVYLYTVDDLQSVIEENKQSRMQAAEKAHEIIDAQVDYFVEWQSSLGSVDVIADIRASTQRLSEEVLAKAQKQLAAGQPPEQVLEYLSHTLTNKFLHRPSAQLRKASTEGKSDLITAAKKLFTDSDKN